MTDHVNESEKCRRASLSRGFQESCRGTLHAYCFVRRSFVSQILSGVFPFLQERINCEA